MKENEISELGRALEGEGMEKTNKIKKDRAMRIKEIREMIVTDHAKCIVPYMGDKGGFGETFCGHIHEMGMTFKELAHHFKITMSELADITADHIRRL